MKKDDIEADKTYGDGKGGQRLVIDFGPQYVLYHTQAETDNLRYRLVAKKRGPGIVGYEYNCTRASFAAWAKHEIVPPSC